MNTYLLLNESDFSSRIFHQKQISWEAISYAFVYFFLVLAALKNCKKNCFPLTTKKLNQNKLKTNKTSMPLKISDKL